MTDNKKPNLPKTHEVWGIYNYGVLIGTERTRRNAIIAVERFVGEPWIKAKKFIQIITVTVSAKELE